MADYAFRSFDERQKIQAMWEAELSAQNIANEMGLSLSSIYTELRRGYDGTRLPNMRRRYDAALAQLRVQESLERRGRRKAAGQ